MFGIELLLFEKNEMEQKLNFNHNALTIEQLLQSRSNCSIVRAIGQFVHTAHYVPSAMSNFWTRKQGPMLSSNDTFLRVCELLRHPRLFVSAK